MAGAAGLSALVHRGTAAENSGQGLGDCHPSPTHALTAARAPIQLSGLGHPRGRIQCAHQVPQVKQNGGDALKFKPLCFGLTEYHRHLFFWCPVHILGAETCAEEG